ncbi:putative ribonuclease H-like domain-containing protein [Tanacetum coccineum]
MILWDGPKWLFDIDSLNQSMIYVPVATGTSHLMNLQVIRRTQFAGTIYHRKKKSDQGIAFCDANLEDAFQTLIHLQDVVNVLRKLILLDNMLILQEVSTSRFKLNTIDPSINTASSSDLDIPKDMFIMGASHTLEATHVEFFSDKDEPEVNLGNILNSYTVSSTPNTRIHKDHPIKNMISDVKSFVQTRRMTKPTSKQGFLSAVYEQKTHDTLNTFWILVDLPIGKRAIGTEWVFRNKKDERGIVIRNKARLVAQGHTQEEGINYEEVFAHVARIKATILFLAYASFMGFLVYQMDVKSAFLYGTIEDEVVKALYGLHQAPKAWYETLANYLLGNGFKKGKIDQTLFIKKQKGDILLVQMSSMGELTFFLGLQVTQMEDGIFISQDKYVVKILKKFNYTDVKSTFTAVDLEKPLVKDSVDPMP